MVARKKELTNKYIGKIVLIRFFYFKSKSKERKDHYRNYKLTIIDK